MHTMKLYLAHLDCQDTSPLPLPSQLLQRCFEAGLLVYLLLDPEGWAGPEEPVPPSI